MADLLRQLEIEKRLLDSLSEYVILIGVVQRDTSRKKVVASVGLTNAELMFIHENGSPIRHIPARPVLEMTIKYAADEMFDEVVNTCVEGILEGWTQNDVEKELKKMCMRMETYARKIIYDNDGRLAPNAPAVADEGKVFQRYDGMMMGKELYLGYDYSLGFKRMDYIEFYEQVDDPNTMEDEEE